MGRYSFPVASAERGFWSRLVVPVGIAFGRLFALLLLLLVLLLCVAAGCSRSSLDIRGGAVQSSGECLGISAAARSFSSRSSSEMTASTNGVAGLKRNRLDMEATRRVYRYKGDRDFDGTAPDTLKVHNAQSGSVSYLIRKVKTARASGPFFFASVWNSLGVVLAILAGCIAISAAVGFFEGDLKGAKAGLIRLVVSVGVAGLGAWLGGSIYCLDNATDVNVQVSIDGNSIMVPTHSFVEVRLGGGEHEAEAKTGGKMIERVVLQPDDGFTSAISRRLLGNGLFIYNVCGANDYSVNIARYGR